MKKKQTSNKSERGQSLAEFALFAMILLLLLAGVVDFGRLYFSFIALRDAAQEGAFYGSVNPADTDGIVQHVRTSSNSPVDLSDTDLVDIEVQNIGAACAGYSIQVTVTENFTITMPFLGTILGTQEFPLSATIANTILSPACG